MRRNLVVVVVLLLLAAIPLAKSHCHSNDIFDDEDSCLLGVQHYAKTPAVEITNASIVQS
jgi:hypothetical protein